MTNNESIQSQPTTSTSAKSRLFRSPTLCLICDDSAVYSHFGAVVCSSCKMFFKRNAEKKQVSRSTKLNILLPTFSFIAGRVAVSLRWSLSNHSHFAKRLCCLSISQVSRTRHASRTHSRQNPDANSKNEDKNRAAHPTNQSRGIHKRRTVTHVFLTLQFLTSNLLDRDRSTLTIEQWNHLSNITHCYDEYHSLSFAQQTVDEQQKLPLKRRFKGNTVEQLVQIFATNVQHLYTKNEDFLSLSPSIQSVLLRRTMLPVASLSCCFLAQTSKLLSNSAFLQTIQLTYGSTSAHYGQLAAERLDRDVVFIKLIMALLIFSTFDCSTDPARGQHIDFVGVQSIVRQQDRYIALTWRYLIHRYDDQQAVRCFSNLLRALFTMQSSLASVEGEQYSQMIGHLVQQTQTSLNL